MWLYILSTLGKGGFWITRIMSNTPLCWKLLWHSMGKVHCLFLFWNHQKAWSQNGPYKKSTSTPKTKEWCQDIKSYLRNWRIKKEREQERVLITGESTVGFKNPIEKERNNILNSGSLWNIFLKTSKTFLTTYLKIYLS